MTLRRHDRRRWRAPLVLALVALLGAGPGCGRIKAWMYAPGDRDEWQQPERVIEALAVAPGDVVADLGAGGGYFTFRLADATGPGGRVYAVDVDDDMVDLIAEEARERGVAQVHTVLAEPGDPGLPEPVQLVFTCNTYHHLEDRVAYFARLRSRLAPGGRVAVIDFREEAFRHHTPAETIRSELVEAGYRLLAEHDFLERQHFLVFAPDAADGDG